MKNKTKKVQLRDVQDVIDIIGGRWRGAILASLCDSGKRFNELKNDLKPITSGVLVKELKYFESSKLVIKTAGLENAETMRYQLTDHGKSLEPLIGQIVVWGQKHRNIMLQEFSVQVLKK